MKYYSEVTKQMYDTEAALKKDEAKVSAEQKKAEEKRQKEAAERKRRADEVNAAQKAFIEARDKYFKLYNEFINDYHGFHFTSTELKKIPEQKDNKSVIESLFNFFGI